MAVYFHTNHPRGLPVVQNKHTSQQKKRVVRFGLIENRYGTCTQSKKTSTSTINRLSNPILGHSSTLLALSPASRKKRGDALLRRKAGRSNSKSTMQPLIGIDSRVEHDEDADTTASSNRRSRRQHPQKDPLRKRGRHGTNRSLNRHASNSRKNNEISTESNCGGSMEVLQLLANGEALPESSNQEQEDNHVKNISRSNTDSTFLTQILETQEEPKIKQQQRTRSTNRKTRQPISRQPTKQRNPIRNRAKPSSNVGISTRTSSSNRKPLLKKSTSRGSRVSKPRRYSIFLLYKIACYNTQYVF